MSGDPILTAAVRERTGTTESRRLRRAGHVPGSLYGHGETPVSFSVSREQLDRATSSGAKVVDLSLDGVPQKALLKELQWDTFGTHVIHVDLLRVDKDETVEVEIAIELHGIAPGATTGVLDHHLHTLPVECPALRIPEKFEVNVNELEIGDAIHVSDLDLPDHLTVRVPPETLVVQVRAAIEVSEVDTDDLGPAEPELIGRKETEEDGDG